MTNDRLAMANVKWKKGDRLSHSLGICHGLSVISDQMRLKHWLAAPKGNE